MDKAVMSVRMKKWAGIIQEAATSGLTKTEFCAEKELTAVSSFTGRSRSVNITPAGGRKEKPSWNGIHCAQNAERKAS